LGRKWWREPPRGSHYNIFAGTSNGHHHHHYNQNPFPSRESSMEGAWNPELSGRMLFLVQTSRPCRVAHRANLFAIVLAVVIDQGKRGRRRRKEIAYLSSVRCFGKLSKRNKRSLRMGKHQSLANVSFNTVLARHLSAPPNMKKLGVEAYHDACAYAW
jgi:hypothetical protein